MSLGIILVHGYTGSCHDFKPLAAELALHFGEESVTNLVLPGHEGPSIPEFAEDLMIAAIRRAIVKYQNQNRKIVIISHSTGGNLTLATLQRFSLQPELLILASAPSRIDQDYFARWDAHRIGKGSIPLVDVAIMIKLINTTGSQQFPSDFPVMVIHGENDELVPSATADSWKGNSSKPIRVVRIPKARHDIFLGQNSHLVIDIIIRAIRDLTLSSNNNTQVKEAIIKVEPEFKDFLDAAPWSIGHLTSSPSAQRAVGREPKLLMAAKNEPVIANIEITTYCNLQCRFCARSRLKKSNQHMPFDMFRQILDFLPHTYKIVLVGLGEPLLHPQIVEFIEYAKSLHKKVGLVTNAMLLSPALSQELLNAGLDSIAFSIDGSSPDLTALVRDGTDFNKVTKNIKEFVKLANTGYQLSKAVFTAVSTANVSHLPDLIDRVAELGVDVIMLSDLNFQVNLEHTLWQNSNEKIETMVKTALINAYAKNLPVLSVHGLEEFGLEKRYPDFLMISPAQLYQRSPKRAWCCSPWQTIPVGVDGNVTICDCQPDSVIGNLFKDSFSTIWNCEPLKKYRERMLSQDPPEACKICPRF